ncbi:MAG: transposase [bacterium]
MKYDPDVHHRRSIRLKDYDYSQDGAYFITICTNNRQCLFGKVLNFEMRLNEMGMIAQQCWDEIPQHFPNAILDEYIVMPNHIHGIILLNDNECGGECRGEKFFAPTTRPHGTSKTVGSIVRGFKIGVTKWVRKNTNIHTIWQRNYYEHIISSEDELNRIGEYICNNPTIWQFDREDPQKEGNIALENEIFRFGAGSARQKTGNGRSEK